MRCQFPSLVFAVSAVAAALASPAWAGQPSSGSGADKPKADGTAKPKGGAAKPDADRSTPPGAGSSSDGSPKGSPAHTGKADNESEMSPEAALARATAFYEAGQYAQCAEAFAGMLDDPDKVRALAPRVRDQAEVYEAACLIAIGKTEAANDRFRTAIREDPQMAVPSAVVFPPAVIERFVVVRSELLEEIKRSEQERIMRERTAAEEARKRAEAERRRVVMLEKLASEETLIARNHRWVATVPFGVGQFQNRDYVLGTIFLASETLLTATAITATAIELHLVSQANGGSNFAAGAQANAKVSDANDQIKTAQIVSLSATAAAALVAIGGVVQAHLAFEPEFRDGSRPRKIPKLNHGVERSVSFEPALTPTKGGAAFGLFGRF